MEIKQTALEWLILEINEHNGFIFTMHYDELFKKAKAMEKEQIIEFAKRYHDFGFPNQTVEEYYNETYGK